jgi:hypothetical protein
MKNPAASSGVSSVFYSRCTPRGGELYPKKRLKMQIDSKPEKIDEIERKIVQLKIEQSVLEKEDDKTSKEQF